LANEARSDQFDELYRTTRDRLAVQLAALTGSHAEANDVVQEAFMRAWLKWETVATYDDPAAWVRRVAHNVAVSRWRRTRRNVLQAVVAGGRHYEVPEPIGIISALQQLPVQQRRAIVLHHVGGLPVVEVAKEMGAPEGTVKSWLSRGRDRLAAELNQSTEGDFQTRPIGKEPIGG
jgi:RNA polymerase sigma-70 factor (ECF subfamily)